MVSTLSQPPMVKEALLHDEAQEQIQRIGRVDILVGIPSHNNARTIGHTVHKIVTPYYGLPGKGSALRTVFKIAAELKAKACAVIDADLRSIKPEWIELLISPVLKEDFDYVAPLYHRHKYDGTITNSIVYPLTRALYGQRVRQPIGGDFGFSGRLAQHYLTHDVWDTDVARFGIDIWMTTTAITGGFKICQSFLGAKIHDAKDPGVDLSARLTQVVSSVFSLMESNHERWARVNGSTPVPLFGFEYTVGLEPIRVNVERMIESFRTGLRELAPIWEKALAGDTFAQIKQLSGLSGEAFRFPANLWVRTVYDFAVAYHQKVIHREHLLKSLTPKLRAALLIVLVGGLVAWVLKLIIQRGLAAAKFDHFCADTGATEMLFGPIFRPRLPRWRAASSSGWCW
jgi:hypothetical protein